jgi:hypothetical protein
MLKTDRPLTDDERQEVAGWLNFALRAYNLDASEGYSDYLQDLLRRSIDGFRSWEEPRRVAKLDTASLAMGCLWGQTICDLLGWEWASVRLGAEWEDYGVVSPNRSHVVFPLRYFRKLLSDPESDQTSKLLYNMLKAGSLPPAEPGSYMVLS